MIFIIGLAVMVDGVWSLWTRHNLHYPICPWFCEAGRITRSVLGLILMVSSIILRCRYDVAWAGETCNHPAIAQARAVSSGTPVVAQRSKGGSIARRRGKSARRHKSMGVPAKRTRRADTQKTSFVPAPVYVTEASYYTWESTIAEGNKGIMANGQKMDNDALVCASWFYRFGQKLRVTDVESGRSCVVTVTDRGPAKRLVKRNRMIDLSSGAFKRLAPLNKGLIMVRVEKL